MKTKFMHLRRFDKKGNLLAKGGKTIAYLVDEQDRVLGMATAQCHENDVYSKQQGRAKAEGRLKSQKYYEDVPSIYEFQYIKDQQTSRFACINTPAKIDR